MTAERPVLVGVDGSEDAWAAVRWAVDEARTRHRPLRLVYAYRWLPPYGSLPPHPSREGRRAARVGQPRGAAPRHLPGRGRPGRWLNETSPPGGPRPAGR